MSDLKLEAGKSYRTRDGKLAIIDAPVATPTSTTFILPPEGRTEIHDLRPTRAEFDALKAEVEAVWNYIKEPLESVAPKIATGLDRKKARELAAALWSSFTWKDTREGLDYWRVIAGRLYQIATDGKL